MIRDYQKSQQGHQSGKSGPKLWSSVAGHAEGEQGPADFLSPESTKFQQEFLTLATGGEEQQQQQQVQQHSQKPSTDSQYGPGPSLRPQSKFQ
ncbi:PREDICTED: protein PRRC2B-like [Priapulus caudatus]|uniref:Protein PRRC2B-like n=1 Tax=Priapulus caudatus TaxID=37621 RepID=A0ABM1F3M8_PRICU|nr:PREDICTED: protein PRRC2B-like [Priapulus caudatus]